MQYHTSLILLAAALGGTFACQGDPSNMDVPGSGGSASGGETATGGQTTTTGGTTGSGGGNSATGGSGGTTSTGGASASTGGSSGNSGTGGDSGQTGTGGMPGMEVGEGYPEHQGAGCNVTAGELIDNANLPNPFQMHDGTIISTMDEWQCRRAEIIKDLEEYEVGPKPAPPEVEASYSGNMLTVTVTTESGTMNLSSTISGSGDCVIIGTAGGNLTSGCRTMAFNHDQVVRNDHSSGNAWPDDAYYTVYPELYEEASGNMQGSAIANGNHLIGNYSAWSWGVSRLIDGLELTQADHGIDLSKIGVHGCSYGGKMALWAGALDQRIALTIAQESGGGGAPAWRTSEDYQDRGGGSVESMEDTNWAWFKDSLMRDGVPHQMPHDHHELIALVAPRAFVVLPGDPGNAWLGAESAYMSFMAARQVWKAMGVEDHAGITVHQNGGAHCSASSAQRSAAQAFVNRFLLGQDENTDIVNGLNANWEGVVDWETPTIPNP